MPNFNLEKDIADAEARIPDQNHTLGKGALQPFRATNNGSRAILQSVQAEQRLPLMRPEVAYVNTGHEVKFGELSSNFLRTGNNFVVIDKIAKYPWDNSDTRKEYMIILNPETNELDLVVRNKLEYISESFGYTFDTSLIDNMHTGSLIPKNTVITKTSMFDEYNLRQDGLNLRTIYMACGATTEDPVVVSESVAKRFESPLVDKVRVMINDNDILLNLFGNSDHDEYKTFPDIGEEITNGILCAIRREKKDEEALFAQSWENLKHVMISDEPYTIQGGKVVDIEIACNNPDALKDSIYNQQILRYYEANKEFAKKVVSAIKPLIKDKKCTMTYDMEKFYCKCKDVVDDVMYISDAVFNNIIMDITILRIIPLRKGDKITDRYGGKGVVSEILPDDQMPEIEIQDGVFDPVDIIYNKCTCVNRLNPGQLFETSVTYIADRILDYMYTNKIDYVTAAGMIYTYLNIISPTEAERFKDGYNSLIDEDKEFFIDSYMRDGCIYVVVPPMAPMSLDILNSLYKAFPFVKQARLRVRQENSDGSYRKIIANRRMVAGYKYIYRLKQFAEEKFSAVSLAATNIKGENTKSKASKLHKSMYASTPVRFGEMEWEDMLHMAAINKLIETLLFLSSSPGARRLSEELLTGSPLEMNVNLDDTVTSRSAEIAAAYLKTIGIRVVHEIIPKNKARAYRIVVEREPGGTEVVQKAPFLIDEDKLDLIISLDETLNNKPKWVIQRCTDETPEQADETMLDIKYNKAIKLANDAKDLYGVKTVRELIEIMKTKKVVKPIEAAKRVVATREPEGI